MKILPQLTQRQCKQFTTQDLSERLDLEITYTKSMLQVLCAKNLVRKELHYSCPQCHSQNVFVCDGFSPSYQCYHCQAILEPTRVENEGRPFYSVSKDDFMQYTKETYPDIFHMTCEPEKEIIPFRPVVVEKSEENVAPVTGDDKVETVEAKPEKTDNDLEKRVVSLENDKKGKNLFWAIVKMIVLLAIMGSMTVFILYEWVDIFIFKDAQPFLYEIFMRAINGSVVRADDLGGVFITLISWILTFVVGAVDVLGWKRVQKYYSEIKKEYLKLENKNS